MSEREEAQRQPAEVTEEWVAFDWRGSRVQVPVEWRPHPGRGSRAWPDATTRVGRIAVPDTDVVLNVTITGSFSDGTGAVRHCSATVGGPVVLDPMEWGWFGVDHDADTIDEALDGLRTDIDSVCIWAERNRP